MQWQPMETAPKDRAIIGLRADNGLPDTVEWCIRTGCWKSSIYSYGANEYGEEIMTVHITHWMDLPEQPKQITKEER